MRADEIHGEPMVSMELLTDLHGHVLAATIELGPPRPGTPESARRAALQICAHLLATACERWSPSRSATAWEIVGPVRLTQLALDDFYRWQEMQR